MSGKTFADLKHIQIPIPSGGQVVMLDTGAVLGPEECAMLQALYSRDPKSILVHVDVIADKGAARFMQQYYVGYSHKSIGDCGTGTLAVEGRSMLVAKAIQDWLLYNGQEASTRYMDFADAPFLLSNAEGGTMGELIMAAWRTFYLRGMQELIPVLRKRYPIQVDEKEGVYEKAIKARAFDIMRGFLPAGAATNVSWHTNLRQLADHLAILRHHPLAEVREVARAIETGALEMYPNSFTTKRYEKTEEYNAWWSEEFTYFGIPDLPLDFRVRRDTIDRTELEQRWQEVMKRRPAKTELPKIMGDLGQVQFYFPLDFGSFRDIERHRSVYQRMPILTPELGFESWYLEQLPEELRNEALELLELQERRIKTLELEKKDAQYYYAMGYKVPNLITGGLPALVYLVELRATSLVHPTLAKRASQMAQALKDLFESYGLVLHLDPDPGRFNAKRGEHDITRRD